MKSIRFCSLVAIFVALSGCASAPAFVKPAPDKLVLGKSTRAEVLQSQQVQPFLEQDLNVNNEKAEAITYTAGESPKFWGLLIERRSGTYTVFNDVLVGMEFDSTYDGESTDFNTDKIASIEKGKTTRAEVIALLGKPSGEVLYPIIDDKKGSGLVYAYTWARFAGMLTSTSSNLLVVSLNENNIVMKVSFKHNGVEQIKG